MKAIVITQPGEPEVLQLKDMPIPTPLATEVLIRVKAAGVNRPDVAQRKGAYPPPAGASPDIPGLEVSGTIAAVGNLVTRWKIGDKVCALLAGGGYAEYVTAVEGHCLPIPQNLDFIDSAAIPETVFTVWHNVFQRGALQPAEHLLIHGGSSGIGTTAIQIAKAFGAKVFATAGSNEKCNVCVKLGADECINYKEKDFEEVLKNIGIDVILDMIGGDYIPKNINLLRADGRLIFINAMRGNKLATEIIMIMQKRLTISGSTLRPRDALFKTTLAREVEKNVWPLIERGEFKPLIYRQFPLQEANKAHELMESSSHIGKIVLTID
jgi:NADPH2:quinone reductase